MIVDALSQRWASYLSAYGDIAADERIRLLKQCVTDDVVFTTPTGEGQGFGNLVAHIVQFQQQFPGAYFTGNSLLTHHGQILAEWTMYKDGSAFMKAHTYARFDEQGLFTNLAGFFQVEKPAT